MNDNKDFLEALKIAQSLKKMLGGQKWAYKIFDLFTKLETIGRKREQTSRKK